MLNISEHLTRRRLASPLAIWGKLPGHADFLRHRCSAAHAHDWQNWVASAWNQASMTQSVQRPRRTTPSDAGGLPLEPRKVAAALVEVPVAFVMQAGTMPFSPLHCVQGVILTCEDPPGRPCPLIVFQQVAAPWQRRTWAGQSGPSPRDILFWVTRIMARVHAAERRWEDLTQAIDSIWRAHAPGWRHLMGAPAPVPARLQLDVLLRSYCAHDCADSAYGLKGIQRLPWTDWPAHSLRAGQPVNAFWQQDLSGGYVNAGAHLSDLLGVSA